MQSRAHLNKLLGLWDALVDPKVGVIRSIEEGPIHDDDPNFFHYYSKACNTARFTRFKNFGENGGVSTARSVAIAKALGEGVERYCSAIYRQEELLFSCYRKLRENAVDPLRMQVYSRKQLAEADFPWAPFDRDTAVHWVRAHSLATDRDILAPAASVYVPFHYSKAEGWAPILQPISTGLACGTSYEEAAISGLCEVIERDAFTLTWQARLNWPRIDPSTIPLSGCQLLARFNAVGIEVQLMNITADFGVPTILAFAVCSATSSPCVAVAAATDLSPEKALVKSLEELAHTRKYSKELMIYTAELEVRTAEGHPNVREQCDHLRFYCPQSAKAFAEFAWSSNKTCAFADLPNLATGVPKNDLQGIVHKIVQAGLEPILCELTTPDISSLGLSVVRALIPGCNPLCMGHRNRSLGGRRLYEVPQKFGFKGLNPAEEDNPYPHPFP